MRVGFIPADTRMTRAESSQGPTGSHCRDCPILRMKHLGTHRDVCCSIERNAVSSQQLSPASNVREAGDPSTSVMAALRSPKRLKIEVLAGLVVALALIPEAISFSIIAGVDPRVGLFASFTMAVTIAITGGRPAMISAATGSIALVIAPLVREHGLDYLIVTVLLGGALQIVLSLLGVARLMRFIPRSVMVGFVNALAILIFLSQMPYLIGVPVLVYPFVGVGLLIMVFLPKLTTVIPAPLIAIVILTAAVLVLKVHIPNVGDEGQLPTSLPTLFIPHVPINLHTLSIIAPYALAVALVGLLESLLTAKLVDDITDTHSDKTRESWGQGVANIVTGIFGGMGGCAMIGQTMINVKVAGARTRISTFLAGLFLLGLVVGLRDIVGPDPDGGTGRGDDHGVGRHDGLAQHHPVYPAPDAAQRNSGHARHRGRHRRDQQPGLRCHRRSTHGDGALRSPSRPLGHCREGR